MSKQPPSSPTQSPWSFSKRCKMVLWEWTWNLFCRWTPKPANPWRVFILKSFGATITGHVFVHQRARIEHPENITLREQVCIGDRAHLYALDRISIGSGTIIAQESYLCTGDHDLTLPHKPLVTAPIVIGKNCFIGLRATILKNVTLGDDCIVGANALVTKSFPDHLTLTGVPACPHK